MNAETREALARITRTVEDLHSTESELRRQRTILRDAATALRTGERLPVVLARIQAERVWAPGSLAHT